MSCFVSKKVAVVTLLQFEVWLFSQSLLHGQVQNGGLLKVGSHVEDRPNVPGEIVQDLFTSSQSPEMRVQPL